MVSDTAQKKSIDPTAGPPARRRVRCYTRGFGLVFAAALVLAGLAYVSALEHLRLRTARELNQQARMAAGVLDATEPVAQRAQVERMADASGRRLLVLGADGKVRIDSLRRGGDAPAREMVAPSAKLLGEAALPRASGLVRVLPPDGYFEDARASLRLRFFWITAAGLGLMAAVLARMATDSPRYATYPRLAGRETG